MRDVLLIDVALWGALIILAALIIIGRWRRSHSRIPAHGTRGEAPELAGRKMAPTKTANVTRLGEDARAPDGAAPRSARPVPTAPPRPTQTVAPRARPHRPGPQRDGRRAPTRAVTPNERIASYYDQADQPIADYLAELGWTQQPPHRPSGSRRRPGYATESPDGATSSETSSQGNRHPTGRQY